MAHSSILLLRCLILYFLILQGFHAFRDAADGHGKHAGAGEFADDFGGCEIIPAVLGIGVYPGEVGVMFFEAQEPRKPAFGVVVLDAAA